MENQSLIYGSDTTQRIVSVEIEGDKATLFLQQDDGSIVTEQRDNRYWILAHNKLNDKFKPLEGNLFYRYYVQTPHKEMFTQARREWKNKDIFSIYNDKESFMVKNGVTYYKGLKQKDVSVLSWDIETTGLVHDDSSMVLLISNTFRDHAGAIAKKLFCYDEYKSQAELLEAWCDWVREINPSILLGHNIFGYDLGYIQFIADRDGFELHLGRDASTIKFNKYTSAYRIDGSRSMDYYSAQVYGREILDTMFLSYKSGVFESYSLKSLIKELGLESKDRTFYDAGTIRDNYKNKDEWKKIKAYAIDDADDSLKLWDRFGAAQFYWSQKVSKTLQSIVESATGSQINNILMRSYLQEGHSLPKASLPQNFSGALSYAKPGVYNNHIRFDVSSLYPSIIIQYDIYDKEKDPKRNFLNMVKLLRDQRLINKRLAKETGDIYYKNLEQSEKLGINSAYGMLGAPGLLFNSPKNADNVTRYGREILSKAVLWSTGKDIKEWMPQDEQL